MVTEGPAEVLHGRRVEREALARLLDAVRGGQSRVLVVSGEPGVGKTALLESAIRSASGFRVMRAVGVESEIELGGCVACVPADWSAGSLSRSAVA
jgi:predicted ATP-dependent serine protease